MHGKHMAGSRVLVLLLAVLISMVCLLQAARADSNRKVIEESFPREEIHETVARYVELREQIDRGEKQWIEIADFFTDDAVFIDPVWGRIEGIEGIRELYSEGMAGVDFTFPIDFTAISGNWVVVKWRQVLPGKNWTVAFGNSLQFQR